MKEKFRKHPMFFIWLISVTLVLIAIALFHFFPQGPSLEHFFLRLLWATTIIWGGFLGFLGSIMFPFFSLLNYIDNHQAQKRHQKAYEEIQQSLPRKVMKNF